MHLSLIHKDCLQVKVFCFISVVCSVLQAALMQVGWADPGSQSCLPCPTWSLHCCPGCFPGTASFQTAQLTLPAEHQALTWGTSAHLADVHVALLLNWIISQQVLDSALGTQKHPT